MPAWKDESCSRAAYRNERTLYWYGRPCFGAGCGLILANVKPLSFASAVLITALRLTAGTVNPVVDVSNDTAQVLNTQDQLLFTLSDLSYQVQAARRGLSPYPVHIAFQLISEPQSRAGDFTAVLESADGSVAVDFPGSFAWLPGRCQSSGYTGPVSALYGSLDLPAGLAAELFSGSFVVLALENQGGPVTVGLPAYKLGTDLSMSFSAAGLGVSAPVVRTEYQDPPAAAPEPNSGGALLVVGAFLCAAGKVLNRVRLRGIQ
jgi:hypothetical protein